MHLTLNLDGWCVLAYSDYLGDLAPLDYYRGRLLEIRVIILLVKLSGQKCIHLFKPHVRLLVLPLSRLLWTVDWLDTGLAHNTCSFRLLLVCLILEHQLTL